MLAILVGVCGIIFVILLRLKYDLGDVEDPAESLVTSHSHEGDVEEREHPAENFGSSQSNESLPESSKKPATMEQECQTFPQSIFDVQQVHEFLESFWTPGAVTPEAAIYFTSVLESIAQHLTEKTISSSKARAGKVIGIEDVVEATENDLELKDLVFEARSSKLENKD